MKSNIPKTFRNANFDEVLYDGSTVEWRVSIYGIVFQNNQVLLIKNEQENYYDVPGGGIEMHESLEDALKRESQEEAGWLLTPLFPVFTCTDWFYHSVEKKFFKSIQMFFLAEGKKIGEPLDEKTKEVVLLPLDDMHKIAIYPQAVQAIKNALSITKVG